MTFLPRARARRGIAALTLLATALLAACAPSEPSGSDGGGSGAAKDTLVVGLPGSLSSLDPAVEGGILNYYVAAISAEGLLGVAADGKLQPAIAESWKTPDAKTYVFQIRKDARFSDGTPVTVDDVLYSLDRARDPVASPSTASYWPELTVAQTGAQEVTITLAQPNVTFLSTVTNAGALWITSRAYGEKHSPAGTSGAPGLGSGPYKAVEFAPDSHATFAADDTWWGGPARYKTVRFDFIPDENTRLLARRSGDIDIALNVPLDQVDAWKGAGDTDVLFASDHSYVGLQLDQDVKPFDDVHVRRAIAHAVDRDAIVTSILHGHGEPALGFPTPEQLGAVVGEDEANSLLAGLPQLGFDLDAAKAELAQSSVPGGFSAELAYPATGPQLGKAALALAENLKTIGIDLKVTEVPIEQWITSLDDETRGLHYTWYFSTTGDPGEVIGWYLRPDNPYGYRNPKVAQSLTDASTETDPKARVADIIAANTQANTDVAAIPLWWGQAATAVAHDLKVDEYTPYLFLGAWPNAITVR
ncbi:ABC transporter substrate-binding protein [Xylanimonas sp. McL0601]|uniref:ABC transporter substrate-binding protein n=1 Tax=Xylanimonas sp. McL0601 TaxID=3414739 RepID=UPI003CF025F8